jgi:hypothetical protein
VRLDLLDEVGIQQKGLVPVAEPMKGDHWGAPEGVAGGAGAASRAAAASTVIAASG